jgi:hypothetical protein
VAVLAAEKQGDVACTFDVDTMDEPSHGNVRHHI